ncbi:uncharacterized protein LOC128679772 [Plodia interpunctella]|uniref:uncharacterized protein LOC128679772 n=1 Tax=Plodia interpunctella TaxID=58824 RepID=UPI002367DC8F|nr:uncharacterized protein LOC128679772 [Plodia interpunctella]
MSFEVDRYAWAHIALCADTTWATEPPDEFTIANQRLLAQHCRISQVLQETAVESQSQSVQTKNQFETTEKRSISSQSPENAGCSSSSSRRSVKDVIPESRLAQFYGNFYYDEAREKCYTNANERRSCRGYNGQGCENSDLTECWMLPEVEYWFRKLVDENTDRSAYPRRRRQYRMLADDDFERWGPSGARAVGEEAVLAAKVLSTRGLWSPPAPAQPTRAPSPPIASRKIRARRRQPRRLTALAPPPPAYCLEVPAQLLCDPKCKFQFDSPRPPQLNITECQRVMGRLSASVQAVMRANAARCPPYRGTNVSRYAPTGQRPARCPDRRYGVWWPRDHPSPRLDHRFQLTHVAPNLQRTNDTPKVAAKTEPEETKTQDAKNDDNKESEETKPEDTQAPQAEKTDEQKPTEKIVVDGQIPSTSAAALETGLRKKRLYSTVLSMSAPAPINLTPVGCVRLSQKLVTPGLLKLNPKIVLPTTRIRPPNVDKKFDELEKEALEQYKASDESIDTKFSELEKQAVEQYSTSNSNTSCSSGNSAEKRTTSSPSVPDDQKNKNQPAKFHKEKVDSVVIYSQNFPDLNARGHTSLMNLKNFHAPPRGEKKEQTHKPKRSLKSEQRAASDTDYDAREVAKGHKGPMRWTLHVVPPKKRHLTQCVSDCSSDEDLEDTAGSIKDAGPRIKRHVTGKAKMSAHGGGDLHPIMRKT